MQIAETFTFTLNEEEEEGKNESNEKYENDKNIERKIKTLKDFAKLDTMVNNFSF
jgi:hypothetical protein